MFIFRKKLGRVNGESARASIEKIAKHIDYMQTELENEIRRLQKELDNLKKGGDTSA